MSIVTSGDFTIIDVNDSLNMRLTQESIVIATDAEGLGGDYATAKTTAQVFQGKDDMTAGWTFTAVASAGLAGTLNGATFTAVDATEDGTYVDITGSKAGFPNLTARFTITKVRRGATGSAMALSASRLGFTFTDGAALPADQSIAVTLIRNGAKGKVSWFADNGKPVLTDEGMAHPFNFGSMTMIGQGDTAYVSLADFGAAVQLNLTAVLGDNTLVQTLVRLDFSTAEAGATRNVFKGEWETTKAYSVGDTVLTTEGGWTCIQAHVSATNNKPPAAAFWTAATVKGNEGVRGSVQTAYSIAGSSWSDASAVAAILAATGNSPIRGDVVTLYNASGFSQTRVYKADGTWFQLAAFFGGDVLVDGTVYADKIAVGAVTSDKIGTGSVTAGKIAAGVIVASNIAAGAITTAKIATGAVTANEIATGAIVAGKIAAGTIVAGDIATKAITTAKIDAGAVTANEIAANTITADKIAANTITAAQMTAGAINTRELAANAVTITNLAIADFENLCPDPQFLRLQDFTGDVGRASAYTSSWASYKTDRVMAMAAGITDTGLGERLFAPGNIGLMPGSYYAECYINLDGTVGNTLANIRIYVYNTAADGTRTYIRSVGSNVNATAGVNLVSCQVDLTDPAENTLIYCYQVRSTNGAPTTAVARFNAPSMRRMNGGELQVDGSLKARHMAAEVIISNVAQLGTAVVSTAAIGNAAIVNAKIADAAITTAKIGDLQVDTLKIKDNAVTVTARAFKNPAITIIKSDGMTSSGGPAIDLTMARTAGLVTKVEWSGIISPNTTDDTKFAQVMFYIQRDKGGTITTFFNTHLTSNNKNDTFVSFSMVDTDTSGGTVTYLVGFGNTYHVNNSNCTVIKQVLEATQFKK